MKKLVLKSADSALGEQIWVRTFALVIGIAAFLLISTIRLDVAPAVDWDEGWSFTVARNWIELGSYGRLLDGVPAPGGLEAAFPVISTVAVAMRTFGVGIWQGRLPAAITMLFALALLFWLARRLYNTKVAIAAFAILFFLAPHPRVNVLWMARQMFAEPLQFLTVLAGFCAWGMTRTSSRAWYLAAIFCWSLAFVTKAQVLPFLILALLAAIGSNLINKRFRAGLWLSAVLGGSLVAWRAWLLIMEQVLRAISLPRQTIGDVFLVLGFVPTWEIRFTAFVVTLLVGTPVVLGLIYFLVQRARHKQLLKFVDRDDDLRIALWVLAMTWLLWFLLAAHAGIVRYLFSPIFIGAPFAAVMLRDFTQGFNLRATLQRLTAPLRTKKFTRQNFGAWIAFLLIVFYLPLTLSISWATWNAAEGLDLSATTTFLNQNTPPAARIETYESPLFLELNRSYHYPPDALHLELNKRAAFMPSNVVYDPLSSDPDYLVVGPTGRTWRLYDAVIAQGAFRRLETFGQYEIYQRVRN